MSRFSRAIGAIPRLAFVAGATLAGASAVGAQAASPTAGDVVSSGARADER